MKEVDKAADITAEVEGLELLLFSGMLQGEQTMVAGGVAHLM